MKQLDPASGQPVAPSSDAVAGEAEPAAIDPDVSLDRRRGQRRNELPEPEVPGERRKGDRRVRKPGLPALLGAILAVDDEEPPPEDIA